MCILPNIARTCGTKFMAYITYGLHNGRYMQFIKGRLGRKTTMPRSTEGHPFFYMRVTRNDTEKVLHNRIYVNNIFSFYRLSCQWMYHINAPPYAYHQVFLVVPLVPHELTVLLRLSSQDHRFVTLVLLHLL